MELFVLTRHRKVLLAVLLTALGLCAGPECASTPANTDDAATDDADEQVIVIPSTSGPLHFALTGTTPEFGKYIASGEITYTGGDQEGPQSGTGVAVLQAEDGDQIVAEVSSGPQADGTTDFTFHWRDSVTLSDGTVVANTGRFVAERPPGLVRVYRCSVCCTQVCALPPFNDCRFVCWSCNCRYVLINENDRSPPSPGF